MSANDQNIRVALLGILPPPNGGIASWTKRMLASSIIAKDVDLFLVDEKMEASREVFGEASKKNYYSEIKRCIRIWKDLSRCIRANDVEVVHANIPAFTLSMLREIGCALVAKSHGAKFVIHFRCTVPVAASGCLAKAVLKVLLKLSDHAIVLNGKSKQFVETISTTEATLVPNFVADSDLPSDSVRRQNGPLANVLYAGGIIEDKGLDDIAQLAQKMRHVQFRVAGHGDYFEKRDVPDNIILLGSLTKEELKSEYIQADSFLFLSRFKGEGFSNSLVEAMSFGLPCVVTDWAANADMIGDEGGFVVNVHDVDAMIRSLSLLNDARLRQEQGARNKMKVVEDYCEATAAKKYTGVYRSVLL